MAKRALPQRASRGQLPPHLREQPSLPKLTKNKIEDQQEKQRKTIEANRKINQIFNLRKYPFGRAIHYFINLDQLPRAPQSISYAINDHSMLKNTYSKDSQLIKQSKVGELINRDLIGLPINPSGDLIIRKQNKCKNVCYAYLFDIQDKKHSNDRLIYTIKTLLKRLHRVSIKDLQGYDCIKKDSDLVQILDEGKSLQNKKHILQNKLSVLTTRKQANYVNWQFDDQVLFYHALNQKLHNKVIQLKNQLGQESLCRLLKEQSDNEEKLQNLIDRKTRYYYSNTPSLSMPILQSLIMNIQKTNDKFESKYPIAILNYNKNLISFTDFLISRRAYSMGEVHFYEAKAIVKKLFKRQLKLKSEKITSYEQYYKLFRKRYDEICRFKKTKIDKQPKRQVISYPLLDSFVNCSHKIDLRENIFEISQSIEITNKQYLFLMVYFWLCQALSSINQYLLQFTDLLEIIGSDFYPKVCNPLVEAIGTPLPGIIFYVFQSLTDLISKTDPLPSINNQLFLQYNEALDVCMIWKGQVICNTEDKGMLPNKKIKGK